MLTDPFGRHITSLRVSITSRCNLNCFYCHNEGHSGNESEMSTDLIVDIISTAVRMGVKRVKFSGGEPLLRDDFEDILFRLPALKNVSATTNGVDLAPRAESLKAAGLDRVNISMDTLDPLTYARICACNGNTHQKVLDGIGAAVYAGLTPVKLNMVMLDGINSHELDDMISFTREYDGAVILQIIEPMDTGTSPHTDIDAVEKELQSRASKVVERTMHRRKKYMVGGAEVEVVRPIDNSVFCANCTRLRVTADGKLKPCLLRSDNLVDVSPDNVWELEALLLEAVSRREPYYKGQGEISI